MSGRWDDSKRNDGLVGVTRGRLKLMVYVSMSIGFGMGLMFTIFTGWP
jgi:hypothetical protein